MLLEEYFGSVFAPTKLRTRDPKTIKLYQISLRHFARSLGRRPLLADLTDETVGAHLTRLRREGRAAATVQKERSNLLAIWRHAAERRIVERFPQVEREIEPRRIPRAWTLDELQSILVAGATETGTIGSVPAGEWWTALLKLLWETGERVGAAMALSRYDVYPERGSIIVRAETRKGKRNDRFYRLSPRAIEALRKLLAYEGEKVFPWPYSEGYLWTRYKKLLKKAGLPIERRSMFHRIRKTTASYIKRNGGDATEALGHTNANTTRSYLDPEITGDSSPIDFLPKLPHDRDEGDAAA